MHMHMHYTWNMHDYILSYKPIFDRYKYIYIYTNMTVDRKPFY